MLYCISLPLFLFSHPPFPPSPYRINGNIILFPLHH